MGYNREIMNHPYRKDIPPYNTPKEYPFSDDWINHNPPMGRVIEEETPPNPDLLLAICFNFRNGVPINAIQKIQEKREKAQANAKSDLKVFRDMMKEGVSIRHISKPTKGWGNTRK